MSILKLKTLVAVAVYLVAELGLFLSYDRNDAPFHYFVHYFAGATLTLLIFSYIVWRRHKMVRWPLFWLFVVHLYAMFPDILFSVKSIPHEAWMDVFVLHVSSHYLPGRNLSWLGLFSISLGIFLYCRHQFNVPETAAQISVPASKRLKKTDKT